MEELVMEICKGSVVTAVAGRDSGKRFLVLDIKDEYAYIADGRTRKSERPKKKKTKHLTYYSFAGEKIVEKLKNFDKITSSEIRKELLFLQSNVTE